jgi:hypothetical protein
MLARTITFGQLGAFTRDCAYGWAQSHLPLLTYPH